MSTADYDRALEFLYGRINYERVPAVAYEARQFKLDRVLQLLSEVGNPQQGMPIVHVAGTKGKGSTSAMIAATLSAAGYRTGLFTSPHLVKLEERIAIDSHPCTADELVALVDRLRPAVERLDAAAAGHPDEFGPTYFELTTVMALRHFADAGVHAAVLEVGLGGRLDSTNVCQPDVSVITSISFDHTRQLGNTLAEIAFEKAGIVKPGVPVVSGVLPEEPRSVIKRVCQERGSRLIQLGVDFQYRYTPPHLVDHHAALGKIDFTSIGPPTRCYTGLSLGLLGEHQAANASVALATLSELQSQGWRVDEEQIRAGLATVQSPARVEIISRRPTVVVDAAHNVASVDALLATLASSFGERRRILIFATTQDKDVRGMLARLLPRFEIVLLTRYQNNPRGVPVEELAAIAAEIDGQHCHLAADLVDAWDQVRRLLLPEDLLCVTGSFFTAAEFRRAMEERPLALDNAAIRPA